MFRQHPNPRSGRYIRSGFSHTLKRHAPPRQIGDWRTRAVHAYHQGRPEEQQRLRAELAARLHGLLGRSIDQGQLYVDLDERLAQATVDGMLFRWDGSSLTLLRPCSWCGSGSFESPAIRSARDLGYALAAWQPLHANCQPDDPANWLETDD